MTISSKGIRAVSSSGHDQPHLLTTFVSYVFSYIPQAAGKGTDAQREAQDTAWVWGLSPVQWAPISEELCTGLAELPPHHSMQGPRLPPGTWLRVSAGSSEGDIVVQLAPDMSADDEAQLHATAVELLNAALPGGCTATGAPNLPPREMLAAVQAEQQGGPPAVDPQPPAAGSAGPTGPEGAGTDALLRMYPATWRPSTCGIALTAAQIVGDLPRDNTQCIALPPAGTIAQGAMSRCWPGTVLKERWLVLGARFTRMLMLGNGHGADDQFGQLRFFTSRSEEVRERQAFPLSDACSDAI
jgi:hypothetical protein